MGRLFWKFFLSYWAALLTALLGVTVTLFLYQVADQGRDSALESGPRATTLVGAAAATLRYGGTEALRSLLEERRRHGDVLVLAIDDAGHDLLGRSVDPGALVQARALANSERPSQVARREQGENGGRYLLYLPGTPSWLLRVVFRGGPPPPEVALLSGLVASLAFGALLAWYVARPIRHLRSAFASLARGQLDTRVGPLMGRRRDEVADLGRDFDAMAQQLGALLGSQRTLLHEVSHELRSPLARLQAAIGLAKQDPGSHEDALDRVEREASRVDELVGQLLTLSRLDSSIADTSDRNERVDLVDLVASVVEDAGFEAEATGRRVTLEAGGEAVANVRPELVHRAVENVVRNAVKYTAPGTVVEVTAGQSNASPAFVVHVADRGPGVAEEELEAIFEPFYRSSSGSSGPGFGLGLAIARRAVAAHGGSVRASRREGGGLVVEIELPLPGSRQAKA
jgi:two-component system, OmpR family, sensor kinase